MQYLTPFALKDNFTFTGTKVRAFHANTDKQRNNVEIVRYNNDNDFILKLKLKQPNDELYVIKGSQSKKAEEVAQMVMATPSQNGQVTEADRFEMPVLEVDLGRKYAELINATVRSGPLTGYFIRVMEEKIKFRLDEAGAKV